MLKTFSNNAKGKNLSLGHGFQRCSTGSKDSRLFRYFCHPTPIRFPFLLYGEIHFDSLILLRDCCHFLMVLQECNFNCRIEKISRMSLTP